MKPGALVVQVTLLIGIVSTPEVRSPPAMTVIVPLFAFVKWTVTAIGFSVAAMELTDGLALGKVSVLGETVKEATAGDVA